MLLDEVVRLRSSNLLEFFSDSKIQYDAQTGIFRKEGQYLKVGDKLKLVGEDKSVLVDTLYYRWSLEERELAQGATYEAVLPQESKVRRFKLESVDNEARWYVFVDEDNTKSLAGNFEDLPPLYHSGGGRVGPSSVLFKTNGTFKEVPYDSLVTQDLELDFSGSHVVVALGYVQRQALQPFSLNYVLLMLQKATEVPDSLQSCNGRTIRSLLY